MFTTHGLHIHHISSHPGGGLKIAFYLKPEHVKCWVEDKGEHLKQLVVYPGQFQGGVMGALEHAEKEIRKAMQS